MSKVILLVVFAFGQPTPVIVQEYRSLDSCESKAYFINRKNDQYSAICEIKGETDYI